MVLRGGTSVDGSQYLCSGGSEYGKPSECVCELHGVQCGMIRETKAQLSLGVEIFSVCLRSRCSGWKDSLDTLYITMAVIQSGDSSHPRGHSLGLTGC